MITYIQPIAIGNALRLFLRPPAGATQWRVLRKDTDTFSGPDDAAALVVYEGDELVLTDIAGLYNGLSVFYRAYYLIAGAWVASASISGQANATFADLSVDPLVLTRNRLDVGLQVYVDRGQLNHVNGRIPVMTASPLFEETPMPVVTLHVASDSSQERFVGDVVGSDWVGDDGDWHSAEGWLSRWQLTIVAWCLNADERLALRNAMKTVLMGNLPVFDAAGMAQVDLQFSDTEDFQTYSAPIYMVTCSLSCYAPSMTDGIDPAIRDVVMTLRS